MALLVGVGSSENKNPVEAVNEAWEQASQPLGGQIPSFLMLLASPTAYDQQKLLDQLESKSPQPVMIGCSTSGEITNAGPKDNSIALMAVYSDQIKFVPGLGKDIKTDARTAGKSFAESVREKTDQQNPRAALILPDGLAGNGADIVRGILDIFGQSFILAGGSAGDDFLFKKTHQYLNYSLMTNNVVGIGLYGQFTFGIGVRHGWIPIGTSRKVTKSKSNIVYELDGKPAIQFYEDQFGKDKVVVSLTEPLAKLAITYPLGIVLEGQSEYLIRDPITVDEKGAITCAAEIPEGSEVYIMIGSREEAIAAAEDAAKKALDQLKGKQPKAIFLFNCIARKKLLMNKKKQEIDAIQKILGPEVPLIGFYTYGEQAPMAGKTITCSFHNETDVLFVLAE